MDAIDQFRKAITAAGLTPPDTINPRQWQKIPGYQKNAKNKAAYCFIFDDMLGGVSGDPAKTVLVPGRLPAFE